MTNKRKKIIDDIIKQIQFTNNTIELINLSYDIKYKSIEKANILINSLTYAECINLFASWEDIPNIFISMLTHDEILTRISKCQTIPRLIRKSLYARLDLLHKLSKE